MMKYRRILKVALLVTVVSGFVPEAFGASPAPGSEFEVDAGRFHLLSGPVRTPGGDQRHQVKSAELQERIRSVQKCWLEGDARVDGTVDYQGIFIDLIYTKFKTVYDLGRGAVARPLETTDEGFLGALDAKYDGLSARERGTIISPFKDMVRLLHGMVSQSPGEPHAVSPAIIFDLATEGQGMLHPELFLYRLMSALEVPDPRFTKEDLPNPYYKKTPIGYVKNTHTPTRFLEAYGNMLDHLAYNFITRLKEDVSVLQSLAVSGTPIDSEKRLGLAEDPDPVFLARGGKIWNDEVGGELAGVWETENREPQEAFNRILQSYVPGFTLAGPLLDTAVPANHLGMAFRLLQASAKDIHSWNIPHDASGPTPVPTDLFLETVQRIVARHYNLRALQAMSENVHAMIVPVRQAVVAPLGKPTRRQRTRSCEA